MDTKYYICLYCHEEFIPKRRHAQKFCSATCRSKAHHQKNKNSALKPSSVREQIPDIPKTINKIDKVTPAGIANAAAGTFVANALTNVFTNHNNLPATKGDILALRKNNYRYQKILNMPGKPDGTLPHFDMETMFVVYLKAI